MTRPEPPRYRHAEAFAVMRYVADDGTDEEYLFNSRDGVTPFVISLRSGKPATHADWASDRRMPEGWTPPPGMRIFADLTPDRARQAATANVDRWLADPAEAPGLLATYGDRETAIAGLAASYLQPGAPDIIDPLEAR